MVRDNKWLKNRLLLGVLATSATVLMAGSSVYPASAHGMKFSGEVRDDSVSETTTFQVPFSHPQALADASLTTEALGYPVVGYRFENDEIVGEFSPRTGYSVDEFLKSFHDSYGTQPEVIAAIIEVPTAEAKSLHTASLAAQGGVVSKAEGAKYDAPAADIAKINSLLADFRATNPPRPDITTSLAATTWMPTQAEIQVIRNDIFTVGFVQYYYWDGVVANTTVMHPDDGWEAEVNIRTAHPDYQAGSRGLLACPADYKDQPFAKNYNWTWSALVNTGSGMGDLASAVGAYADYNDFGDACYRNSMAIGLRTPQAIPAYPNLMQEVLLVILAPRGLDETGRIGGLVQSVNETGCFWQPWLSNTDCMGLTASSSGNRPTLGEHRNWTGPNKCWYSADYGNVAPDPYYCG